ncbi:MAG: ABC transporter permease subunit [Kiloniellales bacterium]|nr:ABC transporter permease subunit [Kiloniellales bacterium]
MSTARLARAEGSARGTAADTDGFYDAVEDFVGAGSAHYRAAFRRLGETSKGLPFNLAAAVFGTIWWGARRLWGWALIAAIAELFAFSRIAKGLFGDLGAAEAAKAAALAARSAARRVEGEEALAAGASNAEALLKSADNLAKIAERAQAASEAAAAQGVTVVVTGLIALVLVKLAQGLAADRVLERRYTRWRNARAEGCALSFPAAGVVGVMFAVVLVSTGIAVTASEPVGWLESFPANQLWRSTTAAGLDRFFVLLTEGGGWFFGAVTWSIRSLLDAIESGLLAMPWPVTMLFIVTLAFLAAGARVAIFSAAAMAYLGLFGFWEQSLRTVALLGAAALIAIALGIPIGILCARRPGFYAAVRPVLDFMQTMPAFVYLIPVIALFGIGKPPGVIATLFFGMPPVIRLTALGLQSVPEDVREAARAFGASEARLLFQVDLPLAAPSIMTGINQTILMSLGMVVIASLIGAKGLGEDVLQALQYAATGSGILSGLAILFCAMVLDRIVQGRRKVRIEG